MMKDTDLKNRFYLYGQHIGAKLKSRALDEQALKLALSAAVFGESTPETTILQAQLFLAGEQHRFQELMATAMDGARNPMDTSSNLYLEQPNEEDLRLLGKFIADHGESGFEAPEARGQILRNLNNGPLALRAEYAKFYVHRYTISLETKVDVLAKLQELQEAAIESRAEGYWNTLRQIVLTNRQPGSK
jgi:hypothetical protein